MFTKEERVGTHYTGSPIIKTKPNWPAIWGAVIIVVIILNAIAQAGA